MGGEDNEVGERAIMGFSTKYGWHSRAKAKRMRKINPWIGWGKYNRRRNKLDKKREAKKHRQFIQKCKEWVLALFIIGVISASVWVYLKNIN